MGKEQWKNTGKELGGAFEGLAKSLIRSVRDGADKVVDWAEGEEPKADGAPEERTVFNDGTWRETGKDIGHAMRDLGKSILATGAEVADNVDDWVDGKDEEAENAPEAEAPEEPAPNEEEKEQ